MAIDNVRFRKNAVLLSRGMTSDLRLYEGPHLETPRSLKFHVAPADMGSVDLDSEEWISDY